VPIHWTELRSGRKLEDMAATRVRVHSRKNHLLFEIMAKRRSQLRATVADVRVGIQSLRACQKVSGPRCETGRESATGFPISTEHLSSEAITYMSVSMTMSLPRNGSHGLGWTFRDVHRFTPFKNSTRRWGIRRTMRQVIFHSARELKFSW
jgi:hypothetical protein